VSAGELRSELASLKRHEDAHAPVHRAVGGIETRSQRFQLKRQGLEVGSRGLQRHSAANSAITARANGYSSMRGDDHLRPPSRLSTFVPVHLFDRPQPSLQAAQPQIGAQGQPDSSSLREQTG
jgi:hypothetical protein